MIRYLADYLTKPGNDIKEGSVLVALFSVSLLMGSVLRNLYIYFGYVMSLEARKMLIAAMFDKVSKLSMRSLTETDSGKLIILVSSDIFQMERPFAMVPFGLAAPFINLACYAVIWWVAGWPYAIAIFGLWILTILCQFCT